MKYPKIIAALLLPLWICHLQGVVTVANYLDISYLVSSVDTYVVNRQDVSYPNGAGHNFTVGTETSDPTNWFWSAASGTSNSLRYIRIRTDFRNNNFHIRNKGGLNFKFYTPSSGTQNILTQSGQGWVNTITTYEFFQASAGGTISNGLTRSLPGGPVVINWVMMRPDDNSTAAPIQTDNNALSTNLRAVAFGFIWTDNDSDNRFDAGDVFTSRYLVTATTFAEMDTVDELNAAVSPPVVILPEVTLSALASSITLSTEAFQLTRDTGTEDALTVNVAFTGTATSGVDFQPIASTVTFPAGSSSVQVRVTPLSNAGIPVEGVSLAATLQADAAYDIGTPSSASVTILNPVSSGLPQVTVTATDSTAAETGLYPAAFMVSRSGSTDDPLTVYFSYSGTGVVEYDLLPVESVTLPAGSASVSFEVYPINDPFDEPADDTYTLQIDDHSTYTVASPNIADFTIADNEDFDDMAPLMLTPVALSETSFQARWMDTHETESGFQIRISPTGLSTWTTYTVPANQEFYTFTGLTAGAAYDIQIRAQTTVSPFFSPFTSSLTFTVRGPSSTTPKTFSEWIHAYNLNTTRSTNGLTGSDPDGDGVSNLVEYALNLDPTVADEGPLNLTRNASQFELGWSAQASRVDVSTALMQSSDLQTWTPAVLSISESGNSRSATAPVSASSTYYRIEAAPSANAEPSSSIVCWGDSLTAGGATSYPASLALATGRTVTNCGIGGDTSIQIVDRMQGLTLTSAQPTASTPAGTVRLVASRYVHSRTVSTNYRSSWLTFSSRIADVTRVEFFNFGEKMGESTTRLSAAVTTNTAVSTSTFNAVGHPFSNGDIVHFSATGLPSPLVTGKPYEVRDVTTDSFALSETLGGSALVLAGNVSATLWGPFIYDWNYTGGGSHITLRTHTAFDNQTYVIWIGRNNNSRPHEIVEDIETAVNHIKSMNARFIVMSILNASDELPGTGSVYYYSSFSLAQWCREKFPEEFVDIRAILLLGGTNSGQDAIDRAADVIPSSLRGDTLHINDAGNLIVVQTLAAELAERGW